MFEITLELVALVVFAALVATMIRLFDFPAGPFDYKGFALGLAASLVAAFLTAWMSQDAGMDLFTFAGFGVVTSAAVGGIATVRAMLGGAKALEEVVPVKVP